MPLDILVYLFVLLLAAFFGGAILKFLGQPPIVGYLLAGLGLGWVFGQSATGEFVEFLAELGIVLLLFSLGLEFPLNRLKSVAKVAIWGGLIQILISIAFV